MSLRAAAYKRPVQVKLAREHRFGFCRRISAPSALNGFITRTGSGGCCNYSYFTGKLFIVHSCEIENPTLLNLVVYHG